MESSSGGHNLPKIQVFRPTMEEFKNFPRFIEFIELQGAHKAGLAKVIPPKEWIPRKSGYDDIDLTIPAPILQSVSGNKGLYQQYNIQQKPIALRDFAKLANDDRHQTPRCNDHDELERKFWKNITFNPPIYGADISGSLYDADQDIWNINHLGTILDRVSDEYSVRIEGVNTAYLYFGMWKTSFCWHTEDMDLYSINYIHYGAPKSWYAIPPEHGRRLERLAAGFFPNEAKLCPAFLRHKMTHISPHVLRRYSIPFNKITQEAGEFMITFPYSYHSGYNHGYNCAESTNFASLRWIEYGKRSLQCTCNSDMVHISMDCFIRNYQPERYELWKAGLDMGPHPEDDQRKLYPAASSGTKVIAGTELQARSAIDNPPSLALDGSRSHKVSRRHPVIARLVPDKEEASKTQSVTMIGTKQTPDTAPPVVKICIPYPEIGQKKRMPSKNLKSSHSDVNKQTMSRKSDRQKLKANAFGTADTGIEVECQLQDVEFDPSCGGKSTGHQLLQNAMPLETGGCGYNVVASRPSHISLEVPSVTSSAEDQGGSAGWGHFSSLGNSLLVQRIDSTGDKTLLTSQTVTSHFLLGCLPDDSKKDDGFFDKKTSILAQSGSVFSCPEASQVGNTLASVSTGSDFCESFDIRSPLLDFKDDLLLFNEEALHEEEIVEAFDERNSSEASRMVDEVTTEAGLDALVSSEMTHKRKMKRKLEKLPKDVEHGKRKKKGSSVEKDSVVLNIQKMCPQLAQVATLFQFLLEDRATEVDYNRKRSLVAPYCDVCSLFTDADDKVPESSFSVRDGTGSHCSTLRPMCSRPRVPEQLFACGPERLEKKSSMNQLESCQQSCRELFASAWSESPLLVCCRCSVCVHASCYGQVKVDAGTMSSWSCDWCLEETFQDACCLCMLRGGAMKRTTTGQWSHITCALVIGEVGFEDVPMRCPIRIENITAVRRKLRCAYCLPLTSGQQPVTTHLGVCVQCTNARCSTSFHVTCGWTAGARFTFSDGNAGQKSIAVRCAKHSRQKSKERSVHRPVPPIGRGEHVIAKHKNGRYYRCLVIGVHSQVFFRVEFEDGSFSDDTYPGDIEWPSCSVAVPPVLGAAVKVRWSDGLLYNATFKGTNPVCLYQVQFEDGSMLTLERKDVWSEKEELPKKVTLRLSVATEMRHNLFQEDFLNKDASSRTRNVQLCYIRDENFVNP